MCENNSKYKMQTKEELKVNAKGKENVAKENASIRMESMKEWLKPTMNNVEKFKQYSTSVPIGCSDVLTIPDFNEWLDNIKVSQQPYVKFDLFFHKGLTEERIDEFASAVRHKYATNEIQMHTDVTEEEMTEIIDFCYEFNGDDG